MAQFHNYLFLIQNRFSLLTALSHFFHNIFLIQNAFLLLLLKECFLFLYFATDHNSIPFPLFHLSFLQVDHFYIYFLFLLSYCLLNPYKLPLSIVFYHYNNILLLYLLYNLFSFSIVMFWLL